MSRHRFRPGRIVPAIALLCVSCGWIEKPNPPMPLAKTATLEVYVVPPTNVPNSRKDTDPATGKAIFLLSPPVISSGDVAAVQRSEDSSERPPSLTVHLTPAGAKKLTAVTTPATGQQLAIVVNGEVVGVPAVRSPLSTSFAVSGGSIEKDFDLLLDSLTEP